MKKVTISMLGTEYPLCFSLRVVRSCGEHFGGLENMDIALTSGGAENSIAECIWLLSQMLDAGYRYELCEGKEAQKPPTEDALMDQFGLEDLADLQQCLTDTMNAGKERTVEAEAQKNGEAQEEKIG